VEVKNVQGKLSERELGDLKKLMSGDSQMADHLRMDDGTVVVVPRSDIEGISHPGTVLRWVGPGLLALGLVAVVYPIVVYVDTIESRVPNAKDHHGEPELEFYLAFAVPGAALLIAGAFVTGVGFSTYCASVDAAVEAQLRIVPTYAARPIDTRHSVDIGLSMQVLW